MKISVPNAALILLGTAVGLLIAEGLVRLYDWQHGTDQTVAALELFNPKALPARLYYQDERLGGLTSLRPLVRAQSVAYDHSVLYETNAFGARDREYGRDKPAGYKRVLVYGDSFPFGYGVPLKQRFSEVMEERLSRVEVINFGVPGYGLDECFVRFAGEGAELRPDVVVILWYATLARRATLRGLVEGGTVELPQGETWGDQHFYDPGTLRADHETRYVERERMEQIRANAQLLSSSRLLSMAVRVYQMGKLRGELERTADNGHPEKRASRDAETPRPFNKTISPDLVKRYHVILRAFRDAVERAGGTLVVVNVDPRYQFPTIAPVLGERHEYLDLSERLSDLARMHPLRFKYDRHFNPDAHINIGTWILERSRSVSLLAEAG